MRLSKNFTLDEFLVSQTAERHGIDMTPPAQIQENIERLVIEIAQPLRESVGSIFISSGYRPPELNTLIGGSKTSAHRFGCAMDLRASRLAPLEVAKRVVELDLPFDQVIHEFGRWVHIGIRWDYEPIRKEQLTAYKDENKKTVYVHGLIPIPN